LTGEKRVGKKSNRKILRVKTPEGVVEYEFRNPKKMRLGGREVTVYEEHRVKKVERKKRGKKGLLSWLFD